MKSVSVFDYGVGNILALTSSLSRVFDRVYTISEIGQIAELACHHLVLPGVGAAESAMRNIDPKEFHKTFHEHSSLKILGICLGMQLLAEFSEEGNGVETLGLIRGTTRRLESNVVGIVPRIGWYRVRQSIREKGAQESLLRGIADESFFYFAHSFSVTRPDNSFIDSVTDHQIVSSISSNRLFGVQFHPERSGDLGLKVLSNFSN